LVAKFAQDAAKNRQVAGLQQQATLDAVPEDRIAEESIHDSQ
jgi:hypothetical protein